MKIYWRVTDFGINCHILCEHFISVFIICRSNLPSVKSKLTIQKIPMIGHVVIGNPSILIVVFDEAFQSVGFPANLNIG